MRAAQQRLSRTQKSRTVSVSAPVWGWNARDPIAEMQDKDAVILDNFFCTPYDVRVRQGYSAWATGISGTVNTLADYSPVSGSTKLFACAGSNIYDVSSAGAVGAAVVSGMTSDKWKHTNFSTAGGNFLYLVNGSDKPQLYNGSTWTAIDGASTPAITGVTTTNLISVYPVKSRLWFIEKNTLKVWYLPVLSVGGAAASIDFSSLVTQGGYLMAMCDWSLDAGYGMDDYVAFITSNGEVLIYKGTDPSSSTTWALIGIYQLGAPIGRNCMVKYAGDVLVICKDGLAPLSKALMSSRVNSQEMLTDKIQHVVSQYTTDYSSNYGWQTQLYPPENMLILNVPVSSSVSYQLVMNTISGAWSRFLNWDAACFELHNDLLFYGGVNAVYKAWDTQADNGVNINFEAQQAFNYCGSDAQLKQVKMVRPIISTDGSPAVLLGVNTDFDTTAPTGSPSFSPSVVSLWDSAIWDTSTWGGGLTVKRDWQTVFAMGYCISAHMIGALKNISLRWAATDYVIESGGIL